MGMFGKDWDDDYALPTGSGKGADRTLGDRALAKLGSVGGFRTVMVPMPDGRTMMVRTKGGRPEYTVNELPTVTPPPTPPSFYMTSGAYDVGAYNLSDFTLTPDFVTYKSGPVTINDDTTFATLMTVPRPLSGAISKIYNDQKLSHEALTTAGVAISMTPPSQFTGLARRMMQGRYGVGNYSPAVSTVMMDSYFGASTGVLYFAAANQYWLVKLQQEESTMVVNAYKLALNNTLKQELDAARLTAAADVIATFETLALASATIPNPTPVVIGSFSMPDGEPVAHGWNFSLTTNLADCVVRQWAGYTYDRHYYHHLRLTFAWDTTEPTVSMTTVESQDGWLYSAKSPIWAPFGSSTKWINKFNAPATPTVSQNCPVYCFYVGDELKVVRWSYSGSSVTFNATNRDNIRNAAEFANSVFGQGTSTWVWEYPYGVQETFGFSMGSETSVGTSKEFVEKSEGELVAVYETAPPTAPPTPIAYSFNTTTQANFFFNPGCGGTDINPRIQLYPPVFANGEYYVPRSGNHYSTWVRTSALVNVHGERGTYSESHTTPIVIAVNDPCTVYIAKHVGRSGTKTISDANGKLLTARVDEWFLNDDLQVVGRWIPPVAKQLNIATIGEVMTFPTNSSTTDSTPYDYKNISVLSNGYAANVWNADSMIFHPGPANEILPVPITAISSSIFNEAKYTNGNLQTQTFQTRPDTYPDTIDLFVGAS